MTPKELEASIGAYPTIDKIIESLPEGWEFSMLQKSADGYYAEFVETEFNEAEGYWALGATEALVRARCKVGGPIPC